MPVIFLFYFLCLRSFYFALFQRTALLRYKSHHTAHPFKMYNSVVFSIFRVVNHRHISLTPKEIPYFVAVTLQVPQPLPHISIPSPREQLIYLLPLKICLFWLFHINRIIQYAVFDWLFTSIIFPRLTLLCMLQHVSVLHSCL